MMLKEAFHNAAHPYEAYMQGYNVLIGDAHIQGDVYQAYTYFFPAEIIWHYQALSDFFDVLIKDPKVPYVNQRNKTSINVFDIALNFLEKINRYIEEKTCFMMGSKAKPLAHAYIGLVADYAIALNTFETMWEIVEEYTSKYHEKPLRSVPLICYHKRVNKDWLDGLLKPMTPETCKYTTNSILAGALSFLYDTIVNCGPETAEIYELFTNDYRATHDNVDLAILSKAKLAAFHTNQTSRSIIQTERILRDYIYSPRSYPSSAYVPPPPPQPKFVKVRVVELYGTLEQGTYASSFIPTASDIHQMEEEKRKMDRKTQRLMWQQMYGRDYDNRWQEDWD